MTIDNFTKYILSIQEAISFLKVGGMTDNTAITADIIDAISAIKDILPYAGTDIASMVAVFTNAKANLDLPEDISEQFQEWCGEIIEKHFHLSQSAPKIIQPKCDIDFNHMLNKITHSTIEELLLEASKSAEKCSESNKKYFELLKRWYMEWYRVDSFKHDAPTFIRYFGSLFQYLKTNVSGLRKLYRELQDYRSKYSLLIVLQNWLTFIPDLRDKGVEHTFPHYYDLDIISCDSNEVFVDCGAFDGDSIISFIESFGSEYKRIYGYELTTKTYQKLKRNMKVYNNIVCRNVGIADKNTSLSMINIEGSEAGNRLIEGGKIMMPVVSLDNDIKEDITFIKMDIEGAEPSALIGAKNHIRRSHPKLAISLYHSINHLLEIPYLIHKIDPTYKFYFRHTGQAAEDGVPFPTEYILIAI